MKQIVPGQKARSPTYLMLLILVIGAAIVLSVSGVAVAKKCDNPPCGGGGGGDDHGDPPAQYCAELTEGGFYFPYPPGYNVTLTRNNRGNEYNPSGGFTMEKPDAFPPYDPDAWTAVFETCLVLTSRLGDITELTVSDKWAISNEGGKNGGAPGSRVLVSLKDAYTDLYLDIEVDLHLVGYLPEDCQEPCFPQIDDGSFVVIEMEEIWFYVHAGGTDSCRINKKFSELKRPDGSYGVDNSVLEMEYGACTK